MDTAFGYGERALICTACVH